MNHHWRALAVLVLLAGCGDSGAIPLMLDQSGAMDTGADTTVSDVAAPDVTDLFVPPEDAQHEVVPPADVVETLDVVEKADLAEDMAETDVCVPDCEGRECGDDGCGGICGECLNWCFPGCETGDPYPDESLCEMEQGLCMTVCCPNCCDRICGDDGCGGSCGPCDNGFACADGKECVCSFEGCGEDCCGDGQVCTEAGCCTPECDGKECGGDGCGFECGSCGADEKCSDGFCVCAYLPCGESCCSDGETCIDDACCQPDCAGKECGSDGCGGSCGQCGADEVCVGAGICACKYVPCGESCCAPGEVCFDGACCEPSCGGAECGDDGCGGSCGECDPGCACGGGSCLGSCGECIASCAGKQCGWDGCGGSCGTCPSNKQCNTTTWLCDPGKCKLPTTFSGEAFKMNSLKAGENGMEGEALDVDNDPNSCAPANMCDGGRDNSFGALMKSLAPALGGTEPLMDAVESGDIVMVVELVDPVLDGSVFLANIYRADPVLPKNQCDFQAETCDFLVDPESFVAQTCLPITAFDNVQAKGNIITAGGPQYAFEFPFVLALTGGQEVVLPATHAKMVSTVELDGQGNIVAMEGIIGCAVKKSAIIDMVDQIPAESLPVSKDLIMMVLDMVVVADIDADGDGTPESVSTGMKFTSIPANLTGLAP